MAKKPIALRLEDQDIAWLDRAVEIVEKNSGQEVSRTWVILELMKSGRRNFEKRFPESTSIKYKAKGLRALGS